MSYIGKWIKAKAAANSSLVALVGARIHPIFIPQSAAGEYIHPAIAWTSTITPADTNKTARSGFYRVSVSFNIWDYDYDIIEQIDAALQNTFDFGEAIAGGIDVVVAEYDGGADMMDETMTLCGRSANFTFRVRRV